MMRGRHDLSGWLGCIAAAQVGLRKKKERTKRQQQQKQTKRMKNQQD
jgi:hypothetical protein